MGNRVENTRRGSWKLHASPQVLLMLAVFFFGFVQNARADVVINELYYNGPGELETLEYIELHNSGKETVKLSAWKLSKGVKFDFGSDAEIGPGSYLLVCADRSTFEKHYGEALPIIGEYSGRLGNAGERLILKNAKGEVVDEVHYLDEAPWPVSPDGGGASLVRTFLASSDAASWGASALPKDPAKAGGSPGRANRGASEMRPPWLIESDVPDARVKPDAPTSLTIGLRGDAAIESVRVFYSSRGTKGGGTKPEEAEERDLEMKLAVQGDKTLATASLPGFAEENLVRVRFLARDARGAERWIPDQEALRPTFSYWVAKDSAASGTPEVRVFGITRPSRTSARNRGGRRFFGGGFPDPILVESPRGSGTMIWCSPKGNICRVFDHVPIRPRKRGGYKVGFHKDRLFTLFDPKCEQSSQVNRINIVNEGRDRFILNEALAYEVYRRAGVPAPLSSFVRLVDGSSSKPRVFLLFEQPNRSFLRRNDRDDGGNLYKILWYRSGVVGQHEKKTNRSAGHEDIEELVAKLRSTEGAEQWKLISERFNVDNAASYFAVNMCLSNWDGFFNNYFTYHDTRGSGRWEIYPWDEDKTWGYYDGIGADDFFFDMPLTFGMNGARRPGGRRFGFGGWWRPPGWFSGPLLANPSFRRRFLRRLDTVARTIYDEEFIAVIDGVEERVRPGIATTGRGAEYFGAQVDALRQHLRKRRAFILDQQELKDEMARAAPE